MDRNRQRQVGSLTSSGSPGGVAAGKEPISLVPGDISMVQQLLEEIIDLSHRVPYPSTTTYKVQWGLALLQEGSYTIVPFIPSPTHNLIQESVKGNAHCKPPNGWKEGTLNWASPLVEHDRSVL